MPLQNSLQPRGALAVARAEVVEQLLQRDPSLHRRSGQSRHRLQAVRPKLGVGVAPVASTGTFVNSPPLCVPSRGEQLQHNRSSESVLKP